MEKSTGDKAEMKSPVSFLARFRFWSTLSCKIYLVLSGVFVALMSAIYIYLMIYGYNKDGEYCYFTKDWSHYHLIIDHEPCVLQWQMLWDFFLIFLMWAVPIQTPAWIVLLILWFRKKAQ
jgi:hypothetical protein